MIWIPRLSDLPAAPRSIVWHWTGGVYTPNRVDLEHYHLLVAGDETLHPGRHPIAANMRRLGRGDEYAAHTGGMNSFRVGLAFCGERDSRHPLKEGQVRAGIRSTALLCYLWQLDPRDPGHLFTHMEAWTIHRVRGTRNHQKIDINRLDFRPDLKADEVGPWMREETARLVDMLKKDPPTPQVVDPRGWPVSSISTL